MNNTLSTPVKNIFSRTALKVLNACAKFANNFAFGFGIRLTKPNGSVVVALDTESGALQDWIAASAHEEKESPTPTELASGAVMCPNEDETYAIVTDEGWTRGENGVKAFLCFRQTDDGVNGALFFREVTIDKQGHIKLIASESENYGAVVTG